MNSKSQLEPSNGSLLDDRYASNAATSFPLCARHQYCRKGNSPNARRMGNHNQEARCLQADSDTRKSMLAGPRSEEVAFAHDSALEGAVRCELVSAAGSDSAPYEFLESIKKEGPQPSDALPPFSCNQN